MTKRHSLEYVQSVFRENGCELLEVEYRHAKQKLMYKCVCGNVSRITYSAFSSGVRCVECKKKRLRELKQKSYKEVKTEIEAAGAELLQKTYKNNKTALLLKCECGREFERNLDSFRVSSRCITCNLLVGEKSPFWKPNISREDRERNRDYREYKTWRKEVFSRDDYTCRKCGSRGGDLAAHHINGFSKFPELRTNLNNGATLCKNCHDNFHKIYSVKNFTESDYKNWVSGRSDVV